MKRFFQKTLCAFLLVPALILGCTKPGSEFVGKWTNSANASDTVDIARNADEFLITGPDGTKIGATLKDETLQMAQPMAGITFTYVKSSDSLLSQGVFGQVEYKRAK